MAKLPSWARNLMRYREGELVPPTIARHGITWIPVSGIAAQCYCELKVEHEYLLGEVPTEAKTKGEEAHEQIIRMKKVSLRRLALEIETQDLSIVSLALFGVVDDLGIVGVPDAVMFRKGIPEWVIELKTTKGNVNFLWEDQALQVQLYGLLLELMGFDCSSLQLAVARIHHEHLTGEVKDRLLGDIAYSLKTDSVSNLERENQGRLKLHLMYHQRQLVSQRLTEKLPYWHSTRPPVSSNSEAKCRACEYNRSCSASLYRPPVRLDQFARW